MKIANAVLALPVLVLAGCVQTGAPPAAGLAPRDPAFERVMSLAEFDGALLGRAIFQETNYVRVAHGSPALEPLPALDRAADMQANYLALTLTVGHLSMFPREHDVGNRVELAGLDPARVGENVIMEPARPPPDAPRSAYTYREFAALLVDGWMNSPPHRDTMLRRKFTHLGCAARLANGIGARREKVFASQVFFLPQGTPEP